MKRISALDVARAILRDLTETNDRGKAVAQLHELIDLLADVAEDVPFEEGPDDAALDTPRADEATPPRSSRPARHHHGRK